MQKRDNFYTDNDDLKYHLTRRIDFGALFGCLTDAQKATTGCADAAEYREMAVTLTEALGELAGTEIAPNAARIEHEPISLNASGDVVLPPSLQANLDKLVAAGAPASGIGPEYGGLGLPLVFELAGHEIIMRACPSTGINVCWFSGIAHIIEKFGTAELKSMVVPRIATGEWSGSMALTEPDAGSDLAALRAYGEKQADGSWKLYGTKRFISNGASQVCLVLAKNAAGATGLGTLSLFLCLRKSDDGRNNYTVTKLEEKLGLHGSATCELAFDGAKAYLLGEDGKGFKHMAQLMNDARLAVSLQAVGYMEATVRLAASYCMLRRTWGKPIAHHEMVAERLLDMETDLRAARSLAYQTGYNQSLLHQIDRRLKNPEPLAAPVREDLEKLYVKAKRRVRRWTPLLKWYTSEKAVDMARSTMQLHGGYGYTKEYRAEFWLRESLILPIYEGTSQIQALMCVKDTLKDVTRSPRKFIETALGLRVQTLRANDPLRKKLYRARQLESAAVVAILLRMLKANVRATISDATSADLIRMVKILSRDLVKMENVGPALLHAERLCEIKALVALAECLVWDAEDDPARRSHAERFLNKSWPRLVMLKAEIEMDDPVIAHRLTHLTQEAGPGAEAATRSAGKGVDAHA